MFVQEHTTETGLIATIGTCSLVFCSAFFISFALGAFIHKKNITLFKKKKYIGDSVIYHHPGIDFEDTWQYDDDDYVGRESYEKDKIKEMAVFESTPSGDVYMEYNKDHDVFHYWSDCSINYSFLSTLARKYNIVFGLVAEEGDAEEDAEEDIEGDREEHAKEDAKEDAKDDAEGRNEGDCSSDSDDFLFVKPKKEDNADKGEGGGDECETGKGTSIDAGMPLYRFIRKGSIEDYIFKQTVCDDDDDDDNPLTMSYADFLSSDLRRE